MSCDINLVGAEVFVSEVESYGKGESTEDFAFHKAIFSQMDVRDRLSWEKGVVWMRGSSDFQDAVQKAREAMRPWRYIIACEKRDSSVEVGGSVRWGGEEGVSFSVYGQAEVHDNSGNYVRGEVEQSSNGEGGLTVSGGNNR